MTNDKKIENVQKRKVLKVLIIVLAIATIVLAMLSLMKNINPIFAIITFLIEFIIAKYREKLDPKPKAVKTDDSKK